MPPRGRRTAERQQAENGAHQRDEISGPFDLAKRLRGAVQARDLKTLERLFQRSEVCEMDDRSVAFVVRTAVEQHSSSALSLLFSQPAVLSMGPRAIAGLLQTAIRYKNVPAVLQLSKLEAAHDINTAYLSYLLEEAVGLGHAEAIKSLSVLQGHQTELEQLVPAGSFAGALRTAVLQGRRQMVYHMSQHEAVQGMEPSIMAGILGTAIYHRSGVITRYLCWVQSAQLLEPGSVADLLEAALQVGDTQAVRYICEELRGAQHLQAEHMTKLLLAAMRQPDATVLCRLCQLPAAQALLPDAAGCLLETALTDTAVCSVADTVCALCELLPGSQALSGDRLQELLRAALPYQRNSSAAATHLCALPAATALRRLALRQGWSSAGSASPTAEAEGCSVRRAGVQELLRMAAAAAAAAHLRSDPASGACTPTSGSRSSSPSSGGRLGRALSSSSSSSSSSPVSLRSRRSRHSTTSSDGGSSSTSGSFSKGLVGRCCDNNQGADDTAIAAAASAEALLCKRLSGVTLMQQVAALNKLPEALEDLLLPC